MTEEIKEIIDYLIDEECTRRIKCITIEESKQLLNYITNLQQENEKLKDWNKKLIRDDLEYVNKSFEQNNYKSRCEKAIEYIKTHYLMPNEPELENILNGSDENE